MGSYCKVLPPIVCCNERCVRVPKLTTTVCVSTGSWFQELFGIWNLFVSWIWSLLYLIGCRLIFRYCCDQTHANSHHRLRETDQMTSRLCVCVCVWHLPATSSDRKFWCVGWSLCWADMHSYSQVIWKFPLSGKFAVICSQ